MSEPLPPGWSWDAPDGQWACHAIGPRGRAVTLHQNGLLRTTGRVPPEVLDACRRAVAAWRRATGQRPRA